MKRFKKFWKIANMKFTYISAIFLIVLLIVTLIYVLISSFAEGEPYRVNIAKNTPVLIACLTAILGCCYSLVLSRSPER